MLQSRNRSLKRRSRFVGFLLIVMAGCLHRVRLWYDSIKENVTNESFITSPGNTVVPPFLAEMYKQARREVTRRRLPPADFNELNFSR